MTEDKVNSPSHYKLTGNLEVIDVRDAILGKMQSSNPTLPFSHVDAWSRSWEYLTRAYQKDGLQDLKKAHWYLSRLIKLSEGSNAEDH